MKSLRFNLVQAAQKSLTQLVTKLILRKYLSCHVANLSTSINPDFQLLHKLCLRDFRFSAFNTFKLGWSCVRLVTLSLFVGELPIRLPDNM